MNGFCSGLICAIARLMAMAPGFPADDDQAAQIMADHWQTKVLVAAPLRSSKPGRPQLASSIIGCGLL